MDANPRSRAAAEEIAANAQYDGETERSYDLDRMAAIIAKHFPPESGWVSVASAKPPSITFQQVNSGFSKPEEVLFCHADGRMSVGYNRDGNYALARPTGAITHWRPLPAPPEKE